MEDKLRLGLILGGKILGKAVLCNWFPSCDFGGPVGLVKHGSSKVINYSVSNGKSPVTVYRHHMYQAIKILDPMQIVSPQIREIRNVLPEDLVVLK